MRTQSAGNGKSQPKLEANLIASQVDGGRIAENIVMFARLLRSAGLPVGPQKVVLATQAVIAAGLDSQKTLYWTLHAVFVNKRSEREIFNQAFVMFWRDPGFIEQMMSLMLPGLKSAPAADDKAMSRRLAESLFKNNANNAPMADDVVEVDASETFSQDEILRAKDFDQMSAQELARAKRSIERLRMLDDVPVAVDRSRVPLARAPQLVDVDFASASLYATLADAGSAPVRAGYTVEALAAGVAEAALLSVAAGTPVLVTMTTAYDPADRVVELCTTVYRGDRYRFRATLARRR